MLLYCTDQLKTGCNLIGKVTKVYTITKAKASGIMAGAGNTRRMHYFICVSLLWLFAITGSSHLSAMIYQVYVIELSKKVFNENAKFRHANPQFNGVLECLYVGMTSKTPAERFKQHKTGYVNKKGHDLSAAIVKKYGAYLRPSLYNHINEKKMTRQEALLMEEKLALELRRKGYAVWFN